ncbi:MAG: hypothetical protein AB1351_03940 [Thermoproteota archaeon]
MLLNAIISRALAIPGCQRLLAGDGITVFELSIKGLIGIIEPASVDMRSARKSLPVIGQAASIAKNLDEYQFMICSMVPSIPDSDPRKLQLQKYRIGVVAAFSRLSAILRELDAQNLSRWNANAGPLMEATSEAYLKAKSNSNLQIASRKEAFEFFGVPEDKIDAALATYYG